jgi:hypothetical protein
MSYEAAIASFGRDDKTLAKSFIISLKNVAANWYERLPLRSITSWEQLKEKFLVNSQGFQADITIEQDFFPSSSMIEKRCQTFFVDSFGLKRKLQRSQMSKL